MIPVGTGHGMHCHTGKQHDREQEQYPVPATNEPFMNTHHLYPAKTCYNCSHTGLTQSPCTHQYAAHSQSIAFGNLIGYAQDMASSGSKAPLSSALRHGCRAITGYALRSPV
jgi:hypothetical protein